MKDNVVTVDYFQKAGFHHSGLWDHFEAHTMIVKAANAMNYGLLQLFGGAMSTKKYLFY